MLFNSSYAEEINLFSTALKDLILEDTTKENIVFLCIGTDRATGDTLGPLVGQKLTSMGIENVYGTLEKPVHATNLVDTIQKIKDEVDKPIIIAIDSSNSNDLSVGTYRLKRGHLKPGEGVGKSLPCVGDIAITGVVMGSSPRFNHLLISSVRLWEVTKIADAISEGIIECIDNLNKIPIEIAKYVEVELHCDTLVKKSYKSLLQLIKKILPNKVFIDNTTISN